ncbi:MAG: glycosyl transferase family 2, partial [Verrucomicrobia bacterium]|nr:glycosyl transferase family 2 [Cytophagales bacterium]
AAKPFINQDTDVLVVSSDTIVESGLGNDIRNRILDCQGLISVADMPGDRWSFARTDEKGKVLEVTEKIRISNHASTGLYYFANGKQLVNIAEAMIAKQEKTRGEYYVIPVYQKMIENGGLVGISVASAMWDLGTPEALQLFLDKN